MRTNWLPAVAAIAWVVSGTAQAQVIAGWDFSQYRGDGALSIDGVTFSNTLDQNYSNLDPTGNAGAEASLLGTMYINGQFGSTSVPAGSGAEPFLPTAGSLVSNLLAPAQSPGDNPFDTASVVQAEGQMFAERISMVAVGSVDVVFSADLSQSGQSISDWTLSFGGKTTEGSSSVVVAFSEDGSSYQSVGTVELSATDTEYVIPLSSDASETAFVRMSFAPSNQFSRPVVDNVAIQVPEPAAWAQVCGVLLGLVVCARRRS